MSDIVLSGIRATGRLHFGNFIGAVQNFVRYQDGDNTCLYFVADWHTLTTLDNPEDLRENLVEMVKDYLAAGLDPQKSIIYAQSSVPEIAELALYLSMLQPLGALQNIPTYKDLIRKTRNKPEDIADEDNERSTLGLITYPVLMAADILGPGATLVPVGEDQVPNVELAQKLARRFNNRFETDLFVVPQFMEDMVRVPGLDGNKMGKSEADNAIDINAPIGVIAERYKKKGVTDPQRVKLEIPGDPYNRCQSVYPVHELVTPGESETREIAKLCQSASIGCGDCKQRLVSSIADILVPFQEQRRYWDERTDEVREILIEGGREARKIIAPTVGEVRELMGVRLYA